MVTAGAMDKESIGSTIARPVTAKKMGTKQEQQGAIQWAGVRITKTGNPNLDRVNQQELTTMN